MLWHPLALLLAVNSPTAPIVVNLSSSVLALSIATFNSSTDDTPPGTAVSPSGTVFCGGVGGYNVPPASVTLQCEAPGATVSRVHFASYGTLGCRWGTANRDHKPNCDYTRALLSRGGAECTNKAVQALRFAKTGGPPRSQNCSAPTALNVFQTACTGKSSCTVSEKAFPDPCTGLFKSLFVQAECTSGMGHIHVPAHGQSMSVASSMVTSLRFAQSAATPGFGFVANNIQNSQNGESHTSIWDAGAYTPATGGFLHSHGHSTDGAWAQIADIRLGSTAKEAWNISVSGSELAWVIERTFLVETVVTEDWLAGFGLNTVRTDNSAEHSTQTPGWVDPDAQLDLTSINHAGFRQNYGNGTSPWYAMESLPSPSPRITWSPSGMEFETTHLACARSSGTSCLPKFVWSRSVPPPAGHSVSTNCEKNTAAPGVPSVDCQPYDVVCPNGDQVNGGPGRIKIGVSSIARGKPASFARAETLTSTWRLRLQQTAGSSTELAPLQLTIPTDAELANVSAQLARQFTEPIAGWWAVSNSPASVTCLHELSWFPMAWSVLGRDDNATLDQLFEKQLDYYGRVSLQQSNSGYIQGRWDISCPENFTAFGANVYTGLMTLDSCRRDQSELHSLRVLTPAQIYMPLLHSLSFHLVCKRVGWSRYYGAINTGNRQYIQRLWPTLTKVAKFITEKYGMNASGFGVPRTPHTTGRPGEWVPANWYDEVNFGGFDAIVGVYSVQALEAMARLARWTLRPSSEIEQFERLVTKARVKYVSVYWDEASGWFGEWRDLDGKLRSTGYTWPNFVAMQELANISEPARRVRTLAAIDENYARIRRDYNVSKDGQWCTPDNLKQLAPHDCHGSCGKWPDYEQGLCFLWTTGWEIYTRARQGDPDGAFELYQKLLGGKASNYSRFRKTRFWQQNAGWGRHESRKPGGGSDVLLDQIVTVWGFLRGCFGIEPTLTGLQVVHRPAKQLEGSMWSFVHLGKRRTAKVLNGSVVLQ